MGSSAIYGAIHVSCRRSANLQIFPVSVDGREFIDEIDFGVIHAPHSKIGERLRIIPNCSIDVVKGVKLSARNRFKGKVVSVEKGVITAKVKVEVKMPVTVTAVITKDAVEDLDIKVGDEVEAIVKSTEVIIAK